jgi:hypothetical protein
MPGVVGVRKELGGGAYQQGFADEIRVKARHHSPEILMRPVSGQAHRSSWTTTSASDGLSVSEVRPQV